MEHITVLPFFVSEVLRHRQTRQRNTGTSSRRLVHLSKHQRHLGLAVELNNLRLLHFVVQIVALSRAFADTSEHGVTSVGLGDVVLGLILVTIDRDTRRLNTNDELLDKHRLAHARTAEQPNLTTTGIRRQQIDDLDPRDQHLGRGRLIRKLGRIRMDGQFLSPLDRSAFVDGIAGDVHDTA